MPSACSHRYEEAIKYFAVVPKYRMQAVELAKQEGLLVTDKKRLKGMSKEQIKEQEEKVIRKVIESKMDIRGVYAKPTYKYVFLFSPFFCKRRQLKG